MRSTLCLLALSLLSVSVLAHFEEHPLSKIKIEHIKKAASTTGTISIDTNQFNGTGSWVNVNWAGLPSHYPGNFDWIGVYSPKPTNYSAVTPVKYKYVIPDGTGSGQSMFWFLNMRASYSVAYFTGGLLTPTLLAESTSVDFDNYHLPLQLHTAYTNDPTQMRVNWNTMGNMFASLNWGTSASHLNNTILRVLTTSYKASDMCGAPASTKGFRAPGYLHSALITGLQPNTQYFYQVGDESSHSKSDILSFWTAPVVGPTTEVDFILFGDLGQVELDGSNEASQMDGSILTTNALQLDLADGSVSLNMSAAVFHIGDISYARGYASLWEQWFYQIKNISEVMPWMVTDGNHERDFPSSGSLFDGHDSGGECGVPYRKRFSMPTSAPDNTWYSLNYGPIHFLFISTEHAFDSNSTQYQFITADLAAVNRKITPFLIVAGHRPMYIDSTAYTGAGGDQPVAKMMRDELEPLFKQYLVDVAFWGHHHSYQRSCPLYSSQCVDPSVGTVHIVTGASGAGFSANLEPTQPTWLEYVEDSIHGYTRAHVRDGQLILDFVDSTDRSIIDSVTIDAKFPIPGDANPDGDDGSDDGDDNGDDNGDALGNNGAQPESALF